MMLPNNDPNPQNDPTVSGRAERFRLPDFSFPWYHYLGKPWKLRWRWLPLPLYYGRAFRKYYRAVTDSLNWTEQQIEADQWAKIKRLVEHAYATVPFYTEWFRRTGITPDDIRDFSDYSKLPIISRDHIRNDLPAFTSSEFARHRGFPSKTSGTTGHPLRFYRTPAVENMRRAVSWRHFNQIGYRFKQRRVSLNVIFSDRDADLLYTFDPLDNVLALNGAFVLEETVRDIHALIRRFQPVMFYGHPSAIATLALLMKRQNLEPLHLPLVFVYSEVMSESEVRLIRRYVGESVYDYFANRENTISAPQFPCGSYHVNSEFVYLELVDAPEEFHDRKLYKVIGTSLMNFAMPLLRYDCDDLAYSISSCPACSIAHPVVSFVGGRSKNFLVSKKGFIHCRFDDILFEHGFERLEDFQIEQTDMENLTLRLVPSRGYNRATDEETVVDLLRSSTKNWFKISVEYVPSITPTMGLKKAKVVSPLAEKELETS